MKKLLSLIAILSTSSFAGLTAHADLKPCGKTTFDPKMTCEKPLITFDIGECDPEQKGALNPTSVSCDSGELVALLKTKQTNYRAVFVKNYNGGWEQKGQVWSTSVSEKVAVKSETPKKKRKKLSEALSKQESKSETKPTTVTHSLAPATTLVDMNPGEAKSQGSELSKAVPEDSLKLKVSGWLTVESESFNNFGQGVTTPFSKNDPLSQQSDINLLSNLSFEAHNGPLTLASTLEVGEVYFGDNATGGAQGLRKNILELRNLYVEEEIQKGTFMRLGLWSVLSDPRGFILSDHHAGVQLRREGESSTSQLWFAEAFNGNPRTPATLRERYFGLSHSQKYGQENSWNLFSVYRGLKETFIDSSDLVTSRLGQSEYYWLGVNNVTKGILKGNFEVNAIASQAQFKPDAGGSSDSNTGWLANVKFDWELPAGVNMTLEELATSGSSDARVGGTQVMGARKNFASPDPSNAYLLTVISNDGGDDAQGSLRDTQYQFGRLDQDEGLRMSVLTFSKSWSPKWDSFIRFGNVKTGSKKTSTNSDDYGNEIDLQFKFKNSKFTSWIFDGGYFAPGSYFTNKDAATLTTVKYKIEF